MREQYIITGLNRLTRRRDQLSRLMAKEQAELMLQREVANRKYQRYQAHQRLKIERLEAVQLTIQFNGEN